MQNVLITGTGRPQALGFNLAKRYLEHGDRMFACVRKSTDAFAELNYQRILSVRIDDRMHFHGPDQKKIPFHQLVSPLIHHEDIGISRANQHELTVRMPVRLIATLLASG